MGRTAFPALPIVFVVAFTLLLAGCGSSTSTNVTAPSGTRCQPSLSGPNTTFGPSGGSGTLTVGVSRECAWSATSQAPWIEITSAREGQGDGTITFRVTENGDPVIRRGSIAVSDQRVDVAQDAAPCRFEVQFPAGQVPSEGGQIVVHVATHSLCRWTAATQAAWVTLAPASGMGPAAVQITILPNAGALRSADIVVAGQALPVTQSAPAAPVPVPTPPGEPVPPTQPAPTPCSYAVSPLQGSFGAAGGSGSISVSTGAGCTWAPVSSATWVVVTSGLSGTGNGQIGYLVTANLSTSSREATITVGGISHRVSQAGVTTTSGPTVDIDGSVGGLSGTCPVLRFTVRGTVVTTDAATKFDDGTCQDLRNGLGVHVKGTRQADGSIHAREVEIDD